MDGFEDVIGGDVMQGRQIREGARDFEDAVVGAGAEIEVGHGVLQQTGGFRVDHAMAAQEAGSQGAVAGDAVAAITILLEGA